LGYKFILNLGAEALGRQKDGNMKVDLREKLWGWKVGGSS
jgi:hypothetical protein